ncbi:hypothetical protein BB558_000217 [Smittium angustum]|uniref:RIC1 C-terminal alpha solenoid region domain-containing protein n=1 Tax=Smittium angustum TaxID=133377 RepID=A0A2U1JEP4_SMIAN|nr:hypothetical protein BB558_000217 [Smittium angustum]
MYLNFEPVKTLELGLSLVDELELDSGGIYKFNNPTGIKKAALSPNASLLAGISDDTIYLWNYKPFYVLSAVRHGGVSSFGILKDIFWNPQTSLFYVLVSGGFIFEYEVNSKKSQKLKYIFDKDHIYTKGCGEAHSLNILGLNQKKAYILPKGIQFICGASDEKCMLIATTDRILFMNWSSQIKASINISDICSENNIVERIVSLGNKASSFVIVYSDGRSFLVKYTSEEDGSFNANMYTFYEHKIKNVDYCPSTELLASSDRDTVYISKIEEDKPKTIKTFKIPNTKDKDIDLLKWGDQGNTLVVCFDSTISLYSILGFHIFTTNLIDESSEIEWLYTTFDIFWAFSTSEIYVFLKQSQMSSQEPNFGDSCIALSIPLGYVPRCGLSKCLSVSFENLIFLTEDKILFYVDDLNTEVDSCQPSFMWNSYKISTMYLEENWPVRYAIKSARLGLIAVAGRRGLAIFNNSMAKWKLFNLKSEESSLECSGGMAFFNRFLIFSCINHSSDQRDEIMFIDTLLPLALDPDRASLIFHSKVLSIELHSSVLTVFLESGNAEIFILKMDNNSLKATYVCSIDTSSFIHDASMVRKILCLGPSSNYEKLPLQHKPQTIDSDEGPQPDPNYYVRKISDRTECFSVHKDFDKDYCYNVWWFDGTAYYREDCDLNSVAEEIIAMTFCSERMSIMGLDQRRLKGNNTTMGLSGIKMGSVSYLHFYFRSCILENPIGDVIKSLERFSGLLHFSISLEYLLHKSLEKKSKNNEFLGKLLFFLSHFECFHLVVGHCARKVESKQWEKLFDKIGGFKGFFTECIELNKFEIAKQLLIVLCTLENNRDAELLVLRFLDKARKNGNMELCNDIVKFICTVSESDKNLFSMII